MIKMKIPIKGMHCRACEITIGQHLEKVPRVTSVSVSLKNKSATIKATSPPSKSDLYKAVRSAGYEIGDEQKPLLSHNPTDYKDLCIGIVVIAIVAILLNVFDLGKLLPSSNVASDGAAAALFTGLVAGISTCMTLVGGLVLGLSAGHAKKHLTATRMQKFRPHIFFNLSRIISFFILGGLIGALGSTFQLQGSTLGVLAIIVGIVMFSMGLQLTNIFPRLNNGGITLPPSIAKFLGLKKHSEKEYSHKNAMALGTISFFLPCGFTQVMQLYAISTGSFTTGALVMGLFAIGTAPGLLGVGGLTSAVKSKASGRFFKIAGVAVMAMALVNITNGYNLSGFHLPSFTAPATSKVATTVDTQTVLKTTFTLHGDIKPNTFTVTKGKTYTLEVDSKDNGQGCMSTIMIPRLFNTPLYLEKGKKQVLEFKADEAGTYPITCAMGILRGNITVI